MAIVQHIVTDPSGVQHVINGPDDATPDEVMAQAQQLIPRPKPGAADYAEVPLNLGGNSLTPAWPVDPAVTQAADERGRFWRELAQAAAMTAGGGALGAAPSVARAIPAVAKYAPAAGRIGGSGVAALLRPAPENSNRGYEALKAMGETALMEGLMSAGANAVGKTGSLLSNKPAVTDTTHVRVPNPGSDPVLVTGRPPVQDIPGAPRPTPGPAMTTPPPGADTIRTHTVVQPKFPTPTIPAAARVAVDAAGQAPMDNNSRYADIPAIAALLYGANRVANWGRNKLGGGGPSTYGGYGGG